MMTSSLRYGVFMLAELALRLCVLPRLRARCIALLGAQVGRNVRIYECRFINLWEGFSNLTIGDDVHIGADCLIDLKGPVRIGNGSTLSPRVVLISHTDPGSAHGSSIVERYPCEAFGVTIGAQCWLGTNTTVLSGAEIGDDVVVGAMALVRGRLEPDSLYVGVPARRVVRRAPESQSTAD